MKESVAFNKERKSSPILSMGKATLHWKLKIRTIFSLLYIDTKAAKIEWQLGGAGATTCFTRVYCQSYNQRWQAPSYNLIIRNSNV